MLSFFGSKPRRRITTLTMCERLESRCLLSAAMKGGSELVAEVHVAHHEKKAPVALPHLDGRFLMITHTDTGSFTGVLNLTQHGKHIKGTLTNPGQPPGKFTAKILIAKSTHVKMTGKVVDRFVASKAIKFETDDFDPDEWPDPEDDFPIPEPPPEIDGQFDDPFDDLPDPPPLEPDFEIQPEPK